MPIDSKPLFRPDALRPKLSTFTLPAALAAGLPSAPPALGAGLPTAPPTRSKLHHWHDLLKSKAADKLKETELLADFLRDIFGDLLGYIGPASGSPIYTIKRESLIEVDGKFADAALGRFSLDNSLPSLRTGAKAVFSPLRTGGAGGSLPPLRRGGQGGSEIMIVLEGKGPRDPLDRPHAGRKRSAVEQALQYAVNLQIDWFLVTNMLEFRLFHKSRDLFTYERFDLQKLVEDDTALKRFVYLLGADRVVPKTGPNHLDTLLADSSRIGREVTAEYYHEYATLRRQTYHELCRQNPDIPPAELLSATQKILDRILFIAFCEKRGLLPPDSIASAFRHKDKYNPRPIWDNFRTLFHWIDEGNADPEISKYNGGLFKQDDLLDRLKIPDVICKGFDKLAGYEYGKDADNPHAKLVDVEILGHIFEQSITDLEQLARSANEAPVSRDAESAQRSAAGEGITNTLLSPTGTAVGGEVNQLSPLPLGERGRGEGVKPTPSKRKKEGAFYTPAFVTRYIVAETLQPVLNTRFEALRQDHEGNAKSTTKKFLTDPTAYDLRKLTAPQRKTLADFWNAWLESLATVRIVDPACGSGAFLLEAFDQLHAHYQQANARYAELANAPLFKEVDKQILQGNLFGMDLNSEAIEICRLSLWIKTAQKDKVLTSLDDNIKQGNSVVAEPTPLDAWRQRFPIAFADVAEGGFDVVIGNPPYVRQEWIARDKPFLEKHYQAYDGVADLYVYFYELGIKLLKPGGRLGFIVTNKWMRAGYGELLRKLFSDAAWVEQVVDFGHAKQIFPDADVFPSILIARKPAHAPTPATTRVCAIPREQLRVDDLSRQIKAEGYDVPRERLQAEPWSLEPPGATELMKKIHSSGIPLKDFAGAAPYRGILTGFNEAYLLDATTKEKLVSADPKSTSLFKRYLRGQDIDRWRAEWNGLWMLALESSANHTWTWSDAGDDAESIFAKAFPAIYAHLNAHREALIKRQDQGTFWWELRACAYWEQFDKPKIMYQEIQYHPCYLWDSHGMLANNKVFL